ncbi:uncharacterized protein RBU57_014781 [Macrochelys suwanniensis]
MENPPHPWRNPQRVDTESWSNALPGAIPGSETPPVWPPPSVTLCYLFCCPSKNCPFTLTPDRDVAEESGEKLLPGAFAPLLDRSEVDQWHLLKPLPFLPSQSWRGKKCVQRRGELVEAREGDGQIRKSQGKEQVLSWLPGLHFLSCNPQDWPECRLFRCAAPSTCFLCWCLEPALPVPLQVKVKIKRQKTMQQFFRSKASKTNQVKNTSRAKTISTCHLKVQVLYLHPTSLKHKYRYLLKKQCLQNLKAVSNVCRSNCSHVLKLQKMACKKAYEEGKLSNAISLLKVEELGLSDRSAKPMLTNYVKRLQNTTPLECINMQKAL